MGLEKNNNVEEIKGIIINTFKFLEDQYLYVPTFKKDNDEVFLTSLEVEYINEIRKRKVAISYTLSNLHNELRHSFTATIIRIPYSNVDDFFSFDNYLEKHNINFPHTIKNMYNKHDAQKILTALAKALNENVSAILIGTDWLSSYYPRTD